MAIMRLTQAQIWLRQEIKTSGKSQAGLARHMKKAGLQASEPMISKIVNGKRKIRDDELEAMIAYFGNSPYEPGAGAAKKAVRDLLENLLKAVG
ncbi:plasmid maintenance system antidote protein, XRE family [Hyphomicrobium denitrificans ATCC 51888]|uniref:Plasmid maintenance system antidote protein, XRE family n=1 Tax=Hyphomicrobium denitrificans (strain ATCC 51888 / DSM 1869 / NCIMB 11706 / TK 0415) TaxID=582899 RepID=D8JWA4_HYPDA|nr:helix-turn-helix transcriptional regulator [Hyphomicrobium denitrificans]ADJ23017.1 plasmid maintenance system antidote protein, XRE family [Hyphomicrobium denitrificans ATCC 51888]